MLRRRTFLVVVVLLIVLIVVWIVLALNCPSAGIALTARARDLHRLKNRISLTATADFDSTVTLDALLQPGDDTNRWSNNRAARIQGEVIDVAYARPEATNCFSPCRRDIHILLAARKGAAKTEGVVVDEEGLDDFDFTLGYAEDACHVIECEPSLVISERSDVRDTRIASCQIITKNPLVTDFAWEVNIDVREILTSEINEPLEDEKWKLERIDLREMSCGIDLSPLAASS